MPAVGGSRRGSVTGGASGGGGGGNGGGWLMPYAGLMTLIFALFVVLYALSLKDVAKFKAAAESIRKAFGGMAAAGQATGTKLNPFAPGSGHGTHRGTPGDESGGDAGAGLGADGAADSCIACMSLDAQSELGKMKAELEALRESRQDEAEQDPAVLKTESADLGDRMQTLVDRRGLVIRLSAQDFFAEGEVIVREDLRPLLDRIGRIVARSKRPVRVEGYSDAGEPKPREFASHWEFSAARAAWVARYWITRFELDPQRIGVAGFAHYRPLGASDSASSDWARGKNRRVEIVVER